MAETELNMPLSAAERLLAEGDGAAALLYIYILKNGSVRGAREALKTDEAALAAARDTLLRLGLCDRPEPEDVPPEYTARDIRARLDENPEFAGLVREVQRRLGRMMSGGDLITLFGVYDYLGMPPEVILPLVAYCMEEYRRRYGEGRLPTLRAIEKEAYVWARLGVMTPERADEHIRRRADSLKQTEAVKRALRIRSRELSPTEEKYVAAWLEMGFNTEALELAYDKTVVKTGAMNWAYMNSIVKSWHSKGLHSVEEIESGDRRGSAAPRGAEQPEAAADELARMRRFVDRIKKD